MYLHLHFYCCYICVLMCNVSTESLTNLNLLRAYKHVFFVFVNGYDNVNYYYISSNWEHFSLNVLIQITPSMRKVVNPLQLMIRVHQSVRKLVKKKVWLIFNKYTYLGQFRYLSLLSM